jgi:biopolymer transport protein ExbD
MKSLQDLLGDDWPVECGTLVATPPRRPTRPKALLRARKRSQRAAWSMSLNLTPMIDTVFNLLFFFMIVSRFGAIEGLLAAKLPARTEGKAAVAAAMEIPRTPLRIKLMADTVRGGPSRVTVEGFHDSPLAIAKLAGALQHIREAEPGFDAATPVYLMAQDGVAWDDVVNAYNAAVAARYERVFFAGLP